VKQAPLSFKSIAFSSLMTIFKNQICPSYISVSGNTLSSSGKTFHVCFQLYFFPVSIGNENSQTCKKPFGFFEKGI
jgi:hypothetical protein